MGMHFAHALDDGESEYRAVRAVRALRTARCLWFHGMIHTLFRYCHVQCPCCGRCVNCMVWDDEDD